MISNRMAGLCSALVLCGLIPGCSGRSSGLDRIPVNGTVTSDSDKPLNGSLSFIPAPGTDGPAAITGVVNGKYHFDRSNGPVAGKYRVTFIRPPAPKPRDGRRVKNTPEPPTFEVDVSATDDEIDFDIQADAAEATADGQGAQR